MDKKCKIIISGEGYSFEREVTKEEADRISMLVLSGNINQPISNNETASEETQQTVIRHRKNGTKKKILPRVEVREAITSMSIDPNSPEYGSYWKLPTKGDRILWLLGIAKNESVDGLYQKEITILSSKVGDHIETKAITPLIFPHKKSGRLVDSPDSKGIKVIRILHPGEEYLKSRIVKK